MTASRVIKDILSQKNMSIYLFCNTYGFNYSKFKFNLIKNTWTLDMLKRVSKALDIDLTMFAMYSAAESEE